MTTRYRLQSIFRDVFSDPKLILTPDMSPASLPDWDSVATVHIVLAIETEFQVRFSTDEVATIASVADLLGYLEKRGC